MRSTVLKKQADIKSKMKTSLKLKDIMLVIFHSKIFSLLEIEHVAARVSTADRINIPPATY